MATLKIRLSNGRFVSHNGTNVEEFSERHVIGNGWECYLNEKGEFTCFSIENYSGIRHKIRFTVKNGYIKTTLKIGDEPSFILKLYRDEEWPTDGIIGLPFGRLNGNRPYFRNASFQDFLDKNGITAVRYGEACDVFELEKKIIDSETVIDEKIYTDGEIETEKVWLWYSNSHTTVIHRKEKVSNATWVIVENTYKGVQNNRILITLKNPREIVDLPKY